LFHCCTHYLPHYLSLSPVPLPAFLPYTQATQNKQCSSSYLLHLFFFITTQPFIANHMSELEGALQTKSSDSFICRQTQALSPDPLLFSCPSLRSFSTLHSLQEARAPLSFTSQKLRTGA
jgi:hypothetical protein